MKLILSCETIAHIDTKIVIIDLHTKSIFTRDLILYGKEVIVSYFGP